MCLKTADEGTWGNNQYLRTRKRITELHSSQFQAHLLENEDMSNKVKQNHKDDNTRTS